MQQGYIINLWVLVTHLERAKDSGHLNLSLDLGVEESEYLHQPVETWKLSQKENFSPSLNDLFQYLKVSHTQEHNPTVLQKFDWTKFGFCKKKCSRYFH